MKTDCETYQVNLSALLDLQLSRAEMAETIQHLSGCADCRLEFERFRCLQEKIDGEIFSVPPSEKVWLNILQALKPAQKPLILKFRRNFTKIIAIAAVILIAFGVGYYTAKPHTRPIGVSIPTILTGKEAQIDEAQFIDFTRDLLNSDPKYSMKMYIVLRTLYENKMEGAFEPANLDEDYKNKKENIHRAVNYQP